MKLSDIVVIETPVRRYGCFNKPPAKKSMVVQSGWYNDYSRGDRKTRQPTMTIIPVDFLPGCQYSKTTVDPRCVGCKHNLSPA